MRSTLLLLLSILIGYAANGQLVEDTITSPVFVNPTPRDNFFGVHVTNMGVMGRQPNALLSNWNRWFGAYSHGSVNYTAPWSGNPIQPMPSSGAWNANVDVTATVEEADINTILESKFTVSQTALPPAGSFVPPGFRPNDPSWFLVMPPTGAFQYNPLQHDCANPIPLMVQNTQSFSKTEWDVVHKRFNPQMYEAVGTWWAEKDVYALLEKNPDLIANNSAAYAFYDSVDATPLRQFTEADKALYSLHRLPAGAWQPLHDWEAQKTWLQNDMALTDSLLHTEGVDTLALLLHRQQLLQQALEADSAMAAHHLQLKQDEAQKEQQAYSKVGLLPQRTYYEEFKKETAEGRLRLRGEAQEALWLDTLRLEKLRYIARQCFLAAGDAVFEARALLSAHEPQSYDDFDICMEQGIVFKMEPALPADSTGEQTPLPVFALYPNPAGSATTLWKLFEPFAADEEVSLWDLHGRLVGRQVAPVGNSSAALPLHHLPNGTYLVKVLKADNLVFTTRLNVLK